MTAGRGRSGAAAAAFSFVLTMGIVNLFADATYEGGASINGPFLKSLGATAAAVGILAGLGEFVGYALRSVSGYIADKTGKHWPITILGYTVNLLAVPAMALASGWPLAASLMVLERTGRAMRKPTVESMLTYASGELGRGWVFALNTALDETGATIGPLLMSLVLFLKASYRTGYAILLVPALAALGAVFVARLRFPAPSKLAAARGAAQETERGFTPRFWLSMVAAAAFGAGLMSYEFISFHLASRGTMSETWIPIGVAVATVAGIGASLLLGRLYDRVGIPVVLAAIGASAIFSPFVFLGGFTTVWLGLVLWGIGYAVQDTLLKAVVAGMLPKGRRNFAFGIFYTGYGTGWLIGAVTTGLLYKVSIPAVIGFSMTVQLASIPLFLLADRRR